MSPDEVSSFWTARALDFIRTQPGDWIRQLTRKLALTYNAVEVADTESQDVYAEWSPLLRAITPLSFGVIFCLAAFGACMTANAWRRLWFLYAVAFTYTLSIVSFYVFARYRFPLVPVLILFAVGGLAAWGETSARPLRGWAIGALVLAGALTFLPLENTRMDRASHYLNIANALLLNPEKWDHAEAFYGKALNEAPQSAETHFGMGMLFARRSRPREAVVHYRAAVERWPDNADIRLNLALALAAMDDYPHALDELDAAARLRPADPTAHLIAGKVLLTRSRPADAWTRYEQALAVQPNNIDALLGAGLALTQLQRPDEAMDMYRLALKVDPRNADAQEVLERTQALLDAQRK